MDSPGIAKTISDLDPREGSRTSLLLFIIHYYYVHARWSFPLLVVGACGWVIIERVLY